MAKRFIDTNLFRKSFIRSLSSVDKLLWIYLFCDCSHAGIWEIDFEVASLFVGSKVTIKNLQKFNGKIVIFDNDTKAFIPEFIEFQYGKLVDNNNAHKAVIKDLRKYGLINEDLEIIDNQNIEGLVRGLQGAPMDMDKDKDMDKDMDKEKEKAKKSKSFIPPTIEEVEIYFGENGYSIESAQKAFNYYSIADWFDSKGTKVRNWKQKMQAVWFKDENKSKMSRMEEVSKW